MRIGFGIMTSLLFSLASSAGAMVIAYGSGTNNTTASGFAQWSNVTGSVGSSAIYLGGGWMLQTNHQGPLPASVDLNGTSYDVVDNSGVRLTNADTTATDGWLYRLTTYPSEASLPGLNLASTTPTTGTTVVMVGYGRMESGTDPSNLVKWDVSGNVWTVSASDPYDKSGYETIAGVKRIGLNQISGPVSLATTASSGDVTVTQTQFDQGYWNTNEPWEGQAAAGDSGGGLFLLDGTLVGMFVGVSGDDGQPANTAVFGNKTYALDIATYRTQILATVPEPATFGLLGGLGAILLARRPGRMRA